MRFKFIYITTCLCLNVCATAFGIVLHPFNEPNEAWTDKPNSNIVGRWSSNASCVAVAPNYLITTNHQNGGIGSTVRFGNTNYIVAQVCLPPEKYINPDLRLCRITTLSGQPANLQFFAPPYDAFDEIDKEIVLGGFGDGRGETLLVEPNIPYGYQWNESFGNQLQRWGTNTIDAFAGTVTSLDPLSATSLIIIDFDAPGDPNSTIYEAAMANHDSGGGMFIKKEDTWHVAGLGFAVENGQLAQSHFRNPNDPNTIDPNSADWTAGVRIAIYSSWIQNIINCSPEISPGDFRCDCQVNQIDHVDFIEHWMQQNCTISNNYCNGSDMNFNSIVDIDDLILFTDQWLSHVTWPP